MSWHIPFYIAFSVPTPRRGLAAAGGNIPPNPISEDGKYADVNFHQLIVRAPVFIKCVLKRQYTPHSVWRPFDEVQIYLQQTSDLFLQSICID